MMGKSSRAGVLVRVGNMSYEAKAKAKAKASADSDGAESDGEI